MKVYEDKEYLDYLMSVENNMNDPKGGWSSETGRWFPHESFENDGSYTIAYGHKIFTDEVMINGEMVKLSEGITDEQARQLKVADVVKHTARAEREFNKVQPMGKNVGWQDLPYNSRLIYSELAYNPGLLKKDGSWRWTKLNKGIKANDWDVVFEESKRYSGGQELKGRNVAFKELLQKKNQELIDSGSRYADVDTGIEAINKVLKRNNMGIPPELISQMSPGQIIKLTTNMLRRQKDRMAEITQEPEEMTVNSGLWLTKREQEIAAEHKMKQEEHDAKMAEIDAQQAKAKEKLKNTTASTPKATGEKKVAVEKPEYFMDEDGKVVQMVGGKAVAME